ncbi:transient receptor potential cation channel subfamily A member 1-like isoform X2 [Dysidea avara]|uniref:transient receptor potential cation channel subfamily A member 1-like isoform X2 n=1 Tax=Dysidea avara TaxID=196820 RepID=UPI00332A3C08
MAVVSEKFDPLGRNETKFTEKVAEFRDEWPEDYAQEVYDENGMNILHYCIVKGYGEAINELLDNIEFDADYVTQSGLTPLLLALGKCKEHLMNDASMRPFLEIAVKLLDSDATVDETVLTAAINYPKVLVDILRKKPNYYKPLGVDGQSPLTKAISGFDGRLKKIGFVELVLRKNADVVIKKLIAEDPAFLKSFANPSGETPLHSAAKLGKVEIVRSLMDSGICRHDARDRNQRTPIVTAFANHEDCQGSPSETIAAILAQLPAPTGVSALQHPYNGMPVIEYDIKYNYGVVVKGVLLLDNDLCEQLLLGKYKFETNNYGTVFHIAARHGFSITRLLTEHNKLNLDYFNVERRSKVPCDFAIEHDHLHFIEEVWEAGRETWSQEIATACKCGNAEALILLGTKTREPLTEETNRELLYLACEFGQAASVDFLLEVAKVSPVRLDHERNKPTMLMVAADVDAADCVKLLLDYSASVYDTDEEGYSALCRAILYGRKKAVMAILTHPVQGEHALNFCTAKDETPMRLLVTHMPDVAKWVLNRQIVRETDKIVYKYDLIDDFDRNRYTFSGPLGFLFHYFAARSPRGTVAPQEYQPIGEEHDGEHGHVRWFPATHKPQNHMLRIMVASQSLDVLNHKLVEKVINHYWRYVIWQWIVLRSIYLLITIFLTAFTVVLPHPKGDICRGIDSDGISDGRRGFLITASVLLILLSLLSLVISAYTLYIAKLGIFHQRRFRVLFEIILAILILLFVIGYGNDEWCSQDWQWNVGAFCTCLSWLTLLVTLKGFRHTAPPINMLFAIIKNFLWIIYVPILLIVAFVLAFYMLFTIPDESYGPYHDIGSTLGTVAILFTGEGDYEGQFNSGLVDFPFASYFLYFVFVIMVGILFNNLLVSLAVGEVQDLQDNATLEQHRLNVEGIVDGLEMFFPFISRKPPDVFIKYLDTGKYYEAEKEYKKAQMENADFEDNILKEADVEMMERINQLESTLSEIMQTFEKKTDLILQRQEEMSTKIENLQQ